jgi:hypothetical protein
LLDVEPVGPRESETLRLANRVATLLNAKVGCASKQDVHPYQTKRLPIYAAVGSDENFGGELRTAGVLIEHASVERYVPVASYLSVSKEVALRGCVSNDAKSAARRQATPGAPAAFGG